MFGMDKDDKKSAAKMQKLIYLSLGALACVFIFFQLFAAVPAGFVGIQDTFGSVSSQAAQPGLVFKAPWTGIHPMSVQTQELPETAETPSKEGLSMSLDVSILYRLDPNRAVEVYKTIGSEYAAVVITPQLRSVIRGMTSEYEAKALYTAAREEIAGKIQSDLEPKLASRGIILEKVLLRSVTLPAKVKDSIEQKLQSEQQSQQMEFILSKERQEADRKVIEAHGIANAQAIIANSLTEAYLRWYWINNLDKANQVFYVPVANDGLPLFKNVDEIPNANWTAKNITG